MVWKFGFSVRNIYPVSYTHLNPILEDGGMVVVISQSGETADTLVALRESKKRGFKFLGIVNVVGSSDVYKRQPIYLRGI